MTVKNWLKGSLDESESRSMLWTSKLAKMNANLSVSYSFSGAVSDIVKLISPHYCSQLPSKIQAKLLEKSIWNYEENCIFINSIDSKTLQFFFSEMLLTTLKNGINLHKIKSSFSKQTADEWSQHMAQCSGISHTF